MAHLRLIRLTDLPHPKPAGAVPPPRVLHPSDGGRLGQGHELAAVELLGGHTTGDQKRRSLPHTTRVYVAQYPHGAQTYKVHPITGTSRARRRRMLSRAKRECWGRKISTLNMVAR